MRPTRKWPVVRPGVWRASTNQPRSARLTGLPDGMALQKTFPSRSVAPRLCSSPCTLIRPRARPSQARGSRLAISSALAMVWRISRISRMLASSANSAAFSDRRASNSIRARAASRSWRYSLSVSRMSGRTVRPMTSQSRVLREILSNFIVLVVPMALSKKKAAIPLRHPADSWWQQRAQHGWPSLSGWRAPSRAFPVVFRVLRPSGDAGAFC